MYLECVFQVFWHLVKSALPLQIPNAPPLFYWGGGSEPPLDKVPNKLNCLFVDVLELYIVDVIINVLPSILYKYRYREAASVFLTLTYNKNCSD